MEDLRRIQKLENIKLLADARRLEILRFLMAAPETLSTLGHKLGEHPARVRHHLKALEEAGFVELVAEEPARGFTKKFYRACARAFLLQELILPDLGERPLTVIGSHDLALDLLAERMRDEFALFSLPVGSLDGLVALRQGVGHLAGSHLFDDASGEYNRPIVRLLFPDRPIHLFTLAHRVQGLLTAPGNPRRIQSLTDVAERNLTFINRNRGSGTRLWLDQHLKQLAITPDRLRGYADEARTHTAVAQAVAEGRADAGLALQASAAQFGLAFIPLFQERFDLAIPDDSAADGRVQILLNELVSADFRRVMAALAGYETEATGARLEVE